MFPIRDHNPSLRRPWVTWGLILVNVAIHLWITATQGGDAATARLYAEYALVPALLSDHGAWQGLITSLFLHADFWHLGSNMLFLWIFGDNMEDALGHVGFLIFYLVGGVAASAAQWASEPASWAPVIGASGAVAAVLGGYILLWPRARVDILIFLVVFIRVVQLRAWIILGIWFAIQLVGGVMPDLVGRGTAYWSHIGGFVAGLILILPLWLLRGGPGYWDRSHGRPEHPPAEWSRLPRVSR